jgi:hypothetical protein
VTNWGLAVAPDSAGVELCDDAVLLVGGQAQVQTTRVKMVEQLRDARAQLEYLALVRAGRERMVDPLGEVNIPCGEAPDDRLVGIRRKCVHGPAHRLRKCRIVNRVPGGSKGGTDVLVD